MRGLFPTHINGHEIHTVWFHAAKEFNMLTIHVGMNSFTGMTVEEVLSEASAKMGTLSDEAYKMRHEAAKLIEAAERIEAKL